MEWSGDRLRGGADARGYDSHWRKARNLFLKQHPLRLLSGGGQCRARDGGGSHYSAPRRSAAVLGWTNWEQLY